MNEKLNTGNYKHLLDVRTDSEWDMGHIKEAERLPLTAMLTQAPDLPKDDEIIITCGIGYRGNIVASFLQNQGFSHAHSLAGGMKAWINAGYPVTI